MALVPQHPPVHHPKNLILEFFGWDKTQPQGPCHLGIFLKKISPPPPSLTLQSALHPTHHPPGYLSTPFPPTYPLLLPTPKPWPPSPIDHPSSSTSITRISSIIATFSFCGQHYRLFGSSIATFSFTIIVVIDIVTFLTPAS
jgi:hypothetical protein